MMQSKDIMKQNLHAKKTKRNLAPLIISEKIAAQERTILVPTK
jgi:hypothetical protein